MSRRLLTLTDGGEYLGISRSRMYQLVNRGVLKTVHVGRLHRIAIEELDSYVDRLHADAEGATRIRTESSESA